MLAISRNSPPVTSVLLVTVNKFISISCYEQQLRLKVH